MPEQTTPPSQTPESYPSPGALQTHTGSAIKAAIDATPQWVLGLSGGMLTLAVCLIAVLQLGGFSAPLGRIMNAKATQIERAAESIDQSSTRLEAIALIVEGTTDRLNALEKRVESIEDTHKRLGVK